MLVLAATASQVGAQTILRVSDTANPGDTISIVGDSITSSQAVSLRPVSTTGVVGTAVAGITTNSAANYLQVTTPKSLPYGLWRVQVGASNVAYVNQAKPLMLEWTQAAPNATVRVFGKALTIQGSTPSIRLMAPNGQAVSATITSSTPYCLAFRIPGTVKPGTVYQVLVRNGSGGQVGEVACEEKLTVTAAGTDPLALGVPWAKDFAFVSNVYNVKTDPRLTVKAIGDGVHDDTAAIQKAMDKAASSGGGEVYLPTGTYRVDNGTLVQQWSKVVVKGDGMGKTVLQYGYRFTPTTPPASAGSGGFWMLNMTALGMLNLTLQNMNTSSVPNMGIFSHDSGGDSENFFKNVEFRQGNGYGLFIGSTDKLLFDGCKVSTLSTQCGPMYLDGNKNQIFRNSTIDYRVGRVVFPYSYKLIFENNVVTRDTNYAKFGMPEQGGIELSFGEQVVVNNNVFQTSGPLPDRGDLDGETIMTQRSNCNASYATGNVISATATSVTLGGSLPSTMLANPSIPMPYPNIVITSGKGMGQVRKLVGRVGNVFVMDTPWTSAPDATSVYALGSWPAARQMYLGNRLTGSNIGISIYNGGLDMVVANNNLLNCGQILVRSEARHDDSGQFQEFTLAWNVLVEGNTVTNTNGFRPAQIASDSTVDNGGHRFGALNLFNEIRRNSLVVTSPVAQWPYDYTQLLSGVEGYIAVTREYDAIAYPEANLGTIFDGNTSSGITYPYLIRNTVGCSASNSSGSY